MHNIRLLAVFLFAPSVAVGQTTLVTATVTDPRGIPYSFASVKAQLVSNTGPLSGQPTVTISNNAQCASAGQGSAPCRVPFPGTAGPVTADVNGKFTLALQDNSLVTPAATQWNFTVTESPGVNPPVGFGPQTFSLAITITGASQDVSAALNAVAPLLSRFPGLLSFTGPPTGACTAGQLAVDSTTGILYTCNAGTWTQATVSSGAGPPSGACTGNQVYLDITTGTLYTCNGMSWTPSSTGGGGGGAFSYSETGLDALMTSAVNTGGISLKQTASLTQPGTALMGPIPTTATTNPVFESASVNQGSASPATATGIPAAATSVAIFTVDTDSGANPGTPSGWSSLATAQNGNGWFFLNLASTSPVTASSVFTTTSWASSLAFLGGSITSVPHSNVAFGGCGVGCISGSLGPVAGGNTILVYAKWAGNAGIPQDVTCTDTLGNAYFTIAVAPGISGGGHILCLAQNVIAGTPTITVKTSVNFFWNSAAAFELSGTGPYFTGPNGPWTFRRFTSLDFAAAVGPTVQQNAITTLNSDINLTIGVTATVLTQVVTMPASGCPCRAFVSYGIHFSTSNNATFDTDVSDGTNVFATAQTGAGSLGQQGGSASSFSTVTYGNGQVVTFTLQTQGNATGGTSLMVKAAPNSIGQNTWMQVSVMSSK